jgi:hypothetical protein
MTANGWFQILLFLALVLLITKPIGVFMTRVFNREKTFMDPVLRPIERLLYRVTGVDEDHEMHWTEYAISMLLFSLVSMIVLYLMERLQGYLPFNPQKLGAVNPPRAGVQHRSFIYDKHQLAELFGRDDNELFHPNGGSRLSQLHVCGSGNCAGNRFHSRRRASPDADDWQFLGRSCPL